MKNKLILIVIFTLFLISLISPITVYADTFGDYVYTDNGDSTCTITDYTGAGGGIEIPEDINELTVTRIGYEAFTGKSLTSVIIPNSVTYIGDSAFSFNGLTSITIPDGVTIIGHDTFYNNSIASVTIPDGLTSIGNFSFANNSLTNITIPDNVISIGIGAFYYNKLDSITIPDSVTSLGESAFQSNNLTSFTIGSGLTSISDNVFSSNSLTSITLPENVTSIGSSAFSHNSLTSIAIPNHITSIGEFSFSSNSSLTSVIISNNITSIPEYAFFDCSLTSVTMPNSVTNIKNRAFSQNSLTSISLPNSLKSIGSYSFSDNNLTSIIIPDSVTNIAHFAFTANSLGSVTIGSNVTSIEYGAFNNNIITEVNGQPSNGIIYSRNKDGSTDYTCVVSYGGIATVICEGFIPSTVTTIGEEAFSSNSLTSVTVPNSVKHIGECAFYCYDTSFSTFMLPAGTGHWKCNNGTVYSGGDLVSCYFEYDFNQIPERKDGVTATTDATVAVNNAFSINLSTIFEDSEGDSLTYQIKLNDSDYISAAENWSYIPSVRGITTLLFKANDGIDDSTETYEVTLTANTAPARKTGVDATATTTVEVDRAFMVNLSGIFEDIDDDILSYQVKLDSDDYIAADESYSYTPTTGGDTVLLFKANDGIVDSSNTYQITLTAEYRNHNITFNPNGGDGFTTFSETHLSNTTFTLENEAFVGSITGYIATGWNTQANGEGVHYDLEASYLVPTIDSTLYVEWQIAEFDILYNLCGGTENGGNPATYIIDDTPITLNDAIRAGYDFIGWYDNSAYAGSVKTTIPEDSTGDKEYWARWKSSEILNGRLIVTYYRNDTTTKFKYLYFGTTTDSGIKNRCKYDTSEVLIEMTLFNESGNRTSLTKYYENGKAEYKYFFNTTTDKKKSMMRYSEEGKPSSKIVYYTNGSTVKKQYFYYETGKIMNVKNFRTNKKLKSQVWFYSNGSSRKQLNTYDLNGKLTSVSKYYPKGSRYYYKRF